MCDGSRLLGRWQGLRENQNSAADTYGSSVRSRSSAASRVARIVELDHDFARAIGALMEFNAHAGGAHHFADDGEQGRRRGRAPAVLLGRLADVGLGVAHAPLTCRNQLRDAHALRIIRKYQATHARVPC